MFNSKRSVTDEQNERHKRLLASILKEEGNKSCADCKTRNPTWASVNLGVFVCLTCSGIHRSLGVHISQVRSCNLDTWLPKQVEFCRVMGNVKGNRYWEARLPKDFRRPPSGNPNPELAAFIRAKYVDRAYAATDSRPPTIDNYTDHPYAKEDESTSAAAAAPASPAASAAPARLTANKASASSPALVVDLLGGFDELASGAAAPAVAPQPAPASSDPFGTFVSAVPAASAPPMMQRSSLEWTDFHAAPSTSSASSASGLPPAPVVAPPVLTQSTSAHHRSHSISEGLASPPVAFASQPSRFSALSPPQDPHKPAHANGGHHGHHGHHSRHHSYASHSYQQPPAHGRSNGAGSDPFAAAPPDDLLAGLTIHHVMESLASPSTGAAAPASASASGDPFSFSSSATPGDLPPPGAGHRRLPSQGRKAGEEVLRLFDVEPSTASAGALAAGQGSAADDPFGDFLSAGVATAYQNGGLKQAASQPHVQVHAGAGGFAGGGVPNLL